LSKGLLGSLVEVARVKLPSFTVDIKEFVGWFGVEVAETVVDELLGTNKIEPSRN
jgi:hypothetical protein